MLIPAIDLLHQRVVRLRRGDYEQVTFYDVNPVDYATEVRKYCDRLHVVDLEAAKTGNRTQKELIEKICLAFGDGVQIGGGIRSELDVCDALGGGATRVVLGTAAMNDVALVRAWAEKRPEKLIVAVDARDGKVATDGWLRLSARTPVDAVRLFDDVPVDSFLYTDIARDGMRSGPAIESTIALARATQRKVLLSGGVSSMEDLEKIAHAAEPLLVGAIVGKALLDGSLSLADWERNRL